MSQGRGEQESDYHKGGAAPRHFTAAEAGDTRAKLDARIEQLQTANEHLLRRLGQMLVPFREQLADLMTVRSAASHLGVESKAIIQAIEDGRLEVYKVEGKQKVVSLLECLGLWKRASNTETPRRLDTNARVLRSVPEDGYHREMGDLVGPHHNRQSRGHRGSVSANTESQPRLVEITPIEKALNALHVFCEEDARVGKTREQARAQLEIILSLAQQDHHRRRGRPKSFETPRQTQAEMLFERKSFVLNFNYQLDLYGLRIETLRGPAVLGVQPGASGSGFIQFFLTSGGILGGFTDSTRLKLASLKAPAAITNQSR
jgi:hypothetical protein